MMTAGFLTGHPDVRWRREALHSYSRQDYDIALDQFLRAARYGDKPAQALLAEMYWKGTGVAPDRPRGSARIAIAAKSKFPNFVFLSATYCNTHNPPDRARPMQLAPPRH